MPTTCSYTTVTLNAGDNFILPPGGELVYVSDKNNIVIPAECNIDLATVANEEAKNYRMQWEIATDTGGSPSNPIVAWEDAIISGVVINDVYTATNINAYAGQVDVVNWLRDTVRAPFWNYSSGIQDEPPTGNIPDYFINHVRYMYVDFTTLPSIAAKCYLTIYAKLAPDHGSSEANNKPTGTNMQIYPYCTNC